MKFLLIIMLVLLLVSCNTVREEDFKVSDIDTDQEGYYKIQSGSFTLRYKVIENEELECLLEAVSSGWIAVGFNPSNQMKDANIIIGYVEDSIGYIRDDYGTGNTSHASDLNLGGSSDVILLSASQEEGITSLKFRIPLDSGDPYDTVLNIGSIYPVIFARGNQNDFETHHAEVQQAFIAIKTN